MLINLSEVFTSEGKTREYSVAMEANVFEFDMGSYNISKKEPVVLTINNLGDRKLLIEGTSTLTLEIPCGRCLSPVSTEFSLDISRAVDMKQTEAERVEELDEQPYILGYNLDVDQLVHNELYVNLPMKVLCDDNCKGICNRCGANLNLKTCDCDITELDPRMSVIRDIFKNA